MSWWRSAPIVFGAVALGAPNGGHAAGLFLPVDPGPNAAPTAKSSFMGRSTPVVPDAWERRVRVARQELATARADVESGGAGRLVLNVRSGVRLDVVVERTAATKWGYSLSGRVAGRSVGFVTLVVHENAVAGSIWTPDSGYELTYLGGGVHALRDVANAPAAACSGALSSEFSSANATHRTNDSDDGSVVDILVVWTPEAEDKHGGAKPQLLSRISHLVAYTNDAFERSGAFVALNLVGAEQVDYLETDSGDWFVDSATDLRRLIVPDDGHMDDVHDRRNALGADLVYLLTRRAGGRASYSGFTTGSGTAWVFAHEVGHVFGVAHDRYESGVLAYQHGFTTLTTGRCVQTIMSYNTDCDVIVGISWPMYASPWRYSPRFGLPLGVPRFSKERGTRGPADAVLTLNRNRHRVANFLPTRAGE